MSGAKVSLTLAIGDYDHVRDLVEGDVALDGMDVNWLRLPVEETFFRFVRAREWEVTELSLAKYCWLRAAGDESVVALPIFPSRSFRHSAIFVGANGPIDDPAALAGGRVGIPEWTQTATVYTRAVLQHEYGVPLESVHWVQAGTNEPGRIEGVGFQPPVGVTLSSEPTRTLNEMLVAGELDAVIAAHPPQDFKNGSGRVVRLFSDYRAVEERYHASTGVFPIMHVVALRADVLERWPWVAMSLIKGFELAKRRGLERALDANSPRYPIPWSFANAQRAVEVFGADPWPYGVEANRVTLEAFLGFAFEQGVCTRRLTVEELFPLDLALTFKI
jgi:4,5-dihydroxyphthalate decarboxylase